MRMPPIYFRWREWYLGEGAYKSLKRAPSVRPPAPTRIPLSWWAHLALFLARRRGLIRVPSTTPPPPLASIETLRFGLWREVGAWLAWGLENGQFTPESAVVTAKSQGAKYLGVQDIPFNRDLRDYLRAACRAAGLKLVVWHWATTADSALETISFWLPDGYSANVEHRGPWEELAKSVRIAHPTMPLSVHTNFSGTGSMPDGTYNNEEAEVWWSEDWACITQSYMVNEQGEQPNLHPDRLDYTARKLGFKEVHPCFGVYRTTRKFYDESGLTAQYPDHSWYLLEYMV